MLYTIDEDIIFTTIALLLLLSIATIEVCRRDKSARDLDERQFIFHGKTFLHSLASNVGALFSLTYFFGAGLIYGFVYGTWFFLTCVLICTVSTPVIFNILKEMDKESDTCETIRTSNPLADFLRKRLSPNDLRIMFRLYIAIYFILLIEELAVSRIVIQNIVPFHPALTTLLLGTICLVAFSYLYAGGFRAVLNSDAIQMLVIGVFVIAMIFTIVKDFGHYIYTDSGAHSIMKPALELLPFVVLFGVSWFVGGYDFFSRLNFFVGKKNLSLLNTRKKFVATSLASSFFVLGVGVVYGIGLRRLFPFLESTDEYVDLVIEHFLGAEWKILAIFFLASVMCMIFTTIDTLTLTLLQLGSEVRGRRLKRNKLTQILLVALTLSCFIDTNGTSVFGIFAGSLMILPALGVLKATSVSVRKRLPRTLEPLVWALIGSFLFLVVLYRFFGATFDSHFIITGIVTFNATVMLAISRTYEHFKQRRLKC